MLKIWMIMTFLTATIYYDDDATDDADDCCCCFEVLLLSSIAIISRPLLATDLCPRGVQTGLDSIDLSCRRGTGPWLWLRKVFDTAVRRKTGVAKSAGVEAIIVDGEVLKSSWLTVTGIVPFSADDDGSVP